MRYSLPPILSIFCVLVLSALLSATELFAAPQLQQAMESVLKQTNIATLLQFSRQKADEYQTNKTKALQLAKTRGWFIRRDHDRGLMELQGVSKNGLPLYYMTSNSVAAQSTSADKVWPGAAANLHLDGTGMTAGEWDGGDVRVSHQEFNNTGSRRVIDKDGTSATHYHSTHVAGTIIAGGVQANARGMAYNATLHAYDWNNDESEMAEAAANGLLISNHSYGYSAGWTWNGYSYDWMGDTSISSEEDFQFGFYSDMTRDLDLVAVNAPYYLIVKAAGNDRGEGDGEWNHPKDGGDDGYDCIAYKAVAKNVLTVGAVRDIPGGYTQPSDVVMTSFSGWGPVDDGRIKPDLCGNGYELYSTYDKDDADYDSISGTSMASPNVTGSLLLLQEHYSTLHGSFMTAATLKALAIHTADEAGPNDGPDYMFGWGMLNTETAARTISDKDVNSLILEETYIPANPYSLTVSATGTEPLMVTVVWTDPAGTPVPDQLDPRTPMLVNDLDLRLQDGSNTWYPYILNVQNPSAAAATGNNDVDNVEKIVIPDPAAGNYTINITHEGTISGGSQNFSLIVTGIQNGDFVQVSTSDVSGVTAHSAVLSGSFTAEGTPPVTESGVVWGTLVNPTVTDNKYSTTGAASFSTTVTGLSASTHYYFRAYAINSDGITYGSNKSFTTPCGTLSAFPWSENFDDSAWPLECWSDFQLADAAGWQRSTSESRSGSGSLFHDDDNVSNSANDWIIPPAFDFSQQTDITLTFWQRENYASWIEYHSVRVSTDSDGNPDNGTWTEIYTGAGAEGSWQEVVLDLTAYAGEANVHIAFQYIGDYADEWWIDDVSITATTVIPNYDVNISLSGAGRVTAEGIDCPGDCTESYQSGTAVTLTATADTGFRFDQWQGDTDCLDGEVTVTAPVSCTAVFIRQYPLDVSVNGYGTVTAAGIHCPGDCSEMFDSGTVISLTATPANGSHFVEWSGDCSGSDCSVTMDQAHTISALFAEDPVITRTLAVTVNGSGTVTSQPPGIACTDSGNSCTADFVDGDTIRLTAAADAGSQAPFISWSGACSGSDTTCDLLMDQAKEVTATFNDASFALLVNVTGRGSGTISSSPPGISCGNDCSEQYASGTVVTLTAAPAENSFFTGWQGNCSEPAGTPPSTVCTVTMQQAETVSGEFDRSFNWLLFYQIFTAGGK